VAGALCAALISGAVGEVLALVLIGLGFVAATSLVFLEIGLSEDRERAREQARPPSGGSEKAANSKRPRLDRMRGRRRRLG
jgi:hypothetical protein